MALTTKGIDVPTLKSAIGRGSADVLIVRMSHAGTVATGTRDVRLQVSFAQLLFHKCHMTHVAPRIRAERILLLQRSDLGSRIVNFSAGLGAGMNEQRPQHYRREAQAGVKVKPSPSDAAIGIPG
jgi:hypothetical protein